MVFLSDDPYQDYRVEKLGLNWAGGGRRMPAADSRVVFTRE